MKKQIEDALRTEFSGLGLSDKTISRLADYLKGSVEKEEDIATAVKRDDVALIAKSIQGEIDGIQKAKKKAEDDLADYKAKHPEPKKEPDDPKEPDEPKLDWPSTLEAFKKVMAETIAPLNDKIAALEGVNQTKAALTGAREAFFGGDYAKKYQDEANDAWDRAVEIFEVTGSKMSAKELSDKASEYFNKYVGRKGVDTSKPLVADPHDSEAEGTLDWSGEKKRLQESGKLPKDNS